MHNPTRTAIAESRSLAGRGCNEEDVPEIHRGSLTRIPSTSREKVMASSLDDLHQSIPRHPPINGTPIPQLPRPPSPSADPGVSPDKTVPSEQDFSVPPPDEIDIDRLSAVAALKILCNTVETLVQLTGDVPPTPPVSHIKPSNLGALQAEKESIARHHEDGQANGRGSPGHSKDHDDVPPKAKTPIGSPEARPTEPLQVPDPQVQPLDLQHGILVRKFYSKKPPGISLEEYLMRVHQYCPMTTGVYLATSLYIHRLAVIEHIIPVTARNAHRLVLAGLRVSMKKLEDYRYSHSRFAKVGGVSETELGKLEVSFCFLTNFDLKASKEMLSAHAMAVGNGVTIHRSKTDFRPKLPSIRDKRTLSMGRTRPVTAMKTEAPAAA